MTAGEQRPVLSFVVHREAAARLRSGSGPLRARVYWPEPVGGRPALLVYLPDDARGDQRCRSLCARTGMVVLAAEHPVSLEDAIAVLEWAADHGRELDADPARLFVAGGLAAAVQRHADEQGWPPVTRYETGE